LLARHDRGGPEVNRTMPRYLDPLRMSQERDWLGRRKLTNRQVAAIYAVLVLSFSVAAFIGFMRLTIMWRFAFGHLT
jgi:hypothetical protein